jgi:hypothetical protein
VRHVTLPNLLLGLFLVFAVLTAYEGWHLSRFGTYAAVTVILGALLVIAWRHEGGER